ncbi:MAG: hypothetical protein LBS34_01490 [Rickettsiales bacterium]|nr:hypothetical protein [Rickettsiales bacterium]
MRTVEKSESSGKRYIFVLLAIFSVVLTYIYLWFKVKRELIESMKVDDSYFELKHGDISVNGFPFFVKSKIKDIEFSMLSKENKITFKTKELQINNLIFTKNMNIVLRNSVDVLFNGNLVLQIRLKENDDAIVIDMSLKDNRTISNLETHIKEFTITDIGKMKGDFMTENTLKNFVLKVIGVENDDYNNLTVRVAADQILTKIISKNIQIENNFELIFSTTKEFDANGKIARIKTDVDTLVLNDITNNYAIGASGQYSIDMVTKNIESNADFKVKNFNSLIVMLNDKNAYFLIKKSNLSNVLQVLELAPADSRDTSSDKYYKIAVSLKTKQILINGDDLNQIIKKVMFSNGTM